MSKSTEITEKDVPLGYSSEPDEYESEQVEDLHLTAEPYEIYVGNTGKVPFEEYHSLFKQHGVIKEMFFWRTHDHLYHARITYQTKIQADNAVMLMNHRMVFFKRIRVSHVNQPVCLNFAAAIRLDDISADATEEEIFAHFLCCGDICFVIKTGFAAYIQFAAPVSAAKAFKMEPILNGDPYTLSMISVDDRIDHIQLIENMKDIKYRKPLVMVENYPELPKGTPLCRYKSNFESVGHGSVRHFKIAPTARGTVTLALCMDKQEDRDAVMHQFHRTIIGNKRLKLYMAPGRARMMAEHVRKYANTQNSITVAGIRPYYNDYDVCMLFQRCGSISFLERIESTWTICFDNPSAVSLARSYYTLSLYKTILEVNEFKPPVPAPKGKEDVGKSEPTKPGPAIPKDFLKLITSEMVQNIKLAVSTKQQSVAEQKPKQAPVQPKKRSSQKSTGERNVSDPKPSLISFKHHVRLSNLPKGIEENDLREFFHGREITSVSVTCSKDLYYPTSVAYIKLGNREDFRAVMQRHHNMYRRKRICILHIQPGGWNFFPERCVMLKNLSKNITEEGIIEELEKLELKVEDVIKPAHHCAYVGFTEEFQVDEVMLSTLRKALTSFDINVFPVYMKVPKTWMQTHSLDIRPLEKVRAFCGATLRDDAEVSDGKFGAHNAHKLFVGNIPRDTQAEDVIDYFNNFGNVVDYAPIEKKSCYLRKSAFLSFLNSKHAQNAYRQQPHFLEGSMLDVHLMDSPPEKYNCREGHIKLLTVKSHSRFLTNDEIRHALQNAISIMHHIRFDAFDDRANFVATYRAKKADVELLCETQYINDEAVKIVPFYDPTPPKENEAREKENISNSSHRKEKEAYLSTVVYNENLKEDMEVRSKPNKESDVPFKSFYNENSVQINNVSLDTTAEDLRDLFVKCGDIVDYRALLLKEDATKICCIKFKIDLAADLACTYSQRMVNGKRILVHLATETLVSEKERSVLVERLNPATTAEQLHDAFSTIGMVKYVQKQSPFSAIVCFKDEDCIMDAVNVTLTTTIPNSGSFVIYPCYEEYNPHFFNKFSCQEEVIPSKRMRAALKARILPEFHQLELDRRMLESLPDDIKSRLINEVSLAREQIPDFSTLSKLQQINYLKTEYQDFTQKEHFLRLTAQEQGKLLDLVSSLQKDDIPEDENELEVLEEQTMENLPDDIKSQLINEVSRAREQIPGFNKLSAFQQVAVLKTEFKDFTQKEHFLRLTAQEQEKLMELANDLQQDDSSGEESDLEVFPPPPKQSRNEKPATEKLDDAIDADRFSNVSSEEDEPIPVPSSSGVGSLKEMEPLVVTMDTSHDVAKISPMSDLSRSSRKSGSSLQMGPQSGDVFPREAAAGGGGSPRFPNTYPGQDPAEFYRRMSPSDGPSRPRMIRSGPGPMMRSHMGGMAPHDDGPPDDRWMQQRIGAMAYNGDPSPRGPPNYGGFNRPPYFR